MGWMNEIASEPVLNQAYAWLCKRSGDDSRNDTRLRNALPYAND